MRLSSSQIEAIKQKPENIFGAQAKLRLFGSGVVNKQRGFTLVELVMTMIIIGIISAVAAPRFFSNDVFQERGAADQVRAALRYGQKIAIAQRRNNVDVNISSAANASCGTELDASGNVNCVIAVPVTAATYRFNGLGQPVPNAAVVIAVGAININIAAETGYVQ